MLLAFDVGNTNIVLGIFDSKGELRNSWRLKTDTGKSADEYGMIFNQLFKYEGFNYDDIDDIIISTVVPSVLYTLQHLSQKYFKKKAMVVEPGIKTGLIIKYDDPKQVGADRILNAVAAREKYDGPLIVIDFGTATTFCAISEKSEYLGGTIAPGIKIASEALFEKTSMLPKVEIDDPKHVICRNTVSSMQSGLVFSHMGMVEYIVSRMREEMKEYSGDIDNLKVIATGGMASFIQTGTECIDYVDRNLTLEGLNIVYEKNSNRNK